MNFATVDTYLPEDLADLVARCAHKTHIEHVAGDIKNAGSSLVSDFDSAILFGASSIKEYMIQKYGDQVVVQESDMIDYYTILFIFPKTSRFAFYHHYLEWHTHEFTLVDGIYTPTSIHIERYYCDDRIRGETATACTEIFDYLPFQLLIFDLTDDMIDFSAIGKKTWRNPEAIVEAFHAVDEYSNR